MNKEDIEYYAKIHFDRKGADRNDMHVHIIVSRKDRTNTKKLSPKTNHTGKKNCGNVKGGFDRTEFFRKCESSFDRRTGYDRDPTQTFDYLNTMKHGSPADIARQVEQAERTRRERANQIIEELKYPKPQERQQEPEPGRSQEQQQEPEGTRLPDIGQQPSKKKRLEEELEPPRRKRSRGFGMGM